MKITNYTASGGYLGILVHFMSSLQRFNTHDVSYTPGWGAVLPLVLLRAAARCCCIDWSSRARAGGAGGLQAINEANQGQIQTVHFFVDLSKIK